MYGEQFPLLAIVKTPFVLSAKRSGSVTNPLRRADILSYAIAFCGLLRRLSAAYANVVPPLTPHLAESVPLLCEQPCACRKAAISRGVFNHSPSRLLSFGIRLARLRAYPVIEFSQSVMSLRKGLIRIVFGLRRHTSSLTPTLYRRLRRTWQKRANR